jgi:hypothetical protein
MVLKLWPVSALRGENAPEWNRHAVLPNVLRGTKSSRTDHGLRTDSEMSRRWRGGEQILRVDLVSHDALHGKLWFHGSPVKDIAGEGLAPYHMLA